jgi:hypothetical protein
MKLFNSFVFIIFCLNISLCQSDWKDGYIITQESDTLRGQINHLAYRTMGEECKFRSGPKSPAISYYPKDIKGYIITNFAYFVSKEIDDENLVFLEYLVDGILDLYYIRMNEKDRYYIQRDTLPLKEIKYEEEIRSKDGIKYLHESTTHVGLVSLYTKDAPELHNRILNLKNDFNNLRNFTVDYHNKVCKDKRCITYRNKDKYTKFAIGPHFGYTQQSYNYDNTNVVGNYFGYGLYFRVWSPRINKNFFVRTGAIISKFDEYDYSLTKLIERITIVKIPFQFEYIIPIPFKVRPRASLGFIYFTNSDTYFIAGIGADMVIDKNVSLSIGYEKGVKSLFGFGLGDNKNNTIIAGVYYQL